MDLEDGSLTPAERGEKSEQLFPGEIFFVEQLHSPCGRFAGHDLRPRVRPLTKHFAAHIAWRDLHARIVANAFHFSANADRVDVQLGIVRIEVYRSIASKPYRPSYAGAVFLECYKLHDLSPCDRCNYQRIPPPRAPRPESHTI